MMAVGLGNIALVTISAERDTSPEVFDVLLHRWRTMSPHQRAFLADQLSIGVATLATAGILAENVGIDEADLAHELARRRYGSTVADAAYCRVIGG